MGSYIALSLLLAQSTLHSITPERVAGLGNLTYCPWIMSPTLISLTEPHETPLGL